MDKFPKKSLVFFCFHNFSPFLLFFFPFNQSSRPLFFVDRLTSYYRPQDLDILDLILGTGHDVAVDHDEIRQLALLDGAFEILFKGGVALEALNHVKAVVMDKTGTITKGNFVLQKIVSAGRMTEEELLKICASCEQNSTHPIGIGITAAAKEKGLELESPAELEEIAGHGIRAEILGSEVLCGNRKLMEKYKVSLKEYKNDAYGAEVLVAIDGKYAGYLLISDTIKEDAKSAVQRLNRQGIFSVMLTGDAQGSAQAVASEVGIDEVHAKLLPQDKLTELQKIRAEKGEVMFVGDGINDAPVLAGADVGAAMGSGADAAIEAADVVFMTSGMEAIPQSIAIAKYSCRISRQNVVVALAVKVLVMILGLCGFASMWAAVFADSGVAMICVLNSVRVLYKK